MDQDSVTKMLEAITAYRETSPLTVIIVAFRISTFKQLDNIICMDPAGKVLHTGTHDEIYSTYADSPYTEYCNKL